MSTEKYAKVGDSVKISFIGKLEDGTIFESSKNNEPLQFTVGNGEVLQGVDEAIIGMKEGQTKTISISSDKCYGAKEKELIINVEKSKLPPDLKLKVGYQLQIPLEDGKPINVRVTDITKDRITLDGNHYLAGKNLFFDITLIEIV